MAPNNHQNIFLYDFFNVNLITSPSIKVFMRTMTKYDAAQCVQWKVAWFTGYITNSSSNPNIGMRTIPSKQVTVFITTVIIAALNQCISVKNFTKNTSIKRPVIITFIPVIPVAMYRDGHTTSAKTGVLSINMNNNNNSNFFIKY